MHDVCLWWFCVCWFHVPSRCVYLSSIVSLSCLNTSHLSVSPHASRSLPHALLALPAFCSLHARHSCIISSSVCHCVMSPFWFLFKLLVCTSVCLVCAVANNIFYFYHLSADASSAHVRAEPCTHPDVRSAPEQGGRHYIWMHILCMFSLLTLSQCSGEQYHRLLLCLNTYMYIIMCRCHCYLL